MTTCNGQANIAILLNPGADICAAGPQFVKALGEHMDNLADAVNGSTLHPIGKIPDVSFHTHGRTTQEDVHIYDSVAGAIISLATAQRLGILRRCYPQSISDVSMSNASNGWNPSPDTIAQIMSTPKTLAPSNSNIPMAEDIMAEFPSVFDGQICTMPGEKFHISLTDDARPFCVTTPRTVPFAYRDIQNEIDLLVSQGIITPNTESTEWCAPIVVTPKSNSNSIRMCVDLSKLNKFVCQEHYPSTTPAEAMADITQLKAKYFTIFDRLSPMSP